MLPCPPRPVLLLILGLLGVGTPMGTARSSPVVERVVAVVDTELVLLSEVRLEAWLADHDTPPLPAWSARQPDPVARAIDQATVHRAAGDVALYRPADDAVARRFEAVRRRFDTRAAWAEALRALGTNEDGVRQGLERRMLAEAWLRQKVPARPAQPEAWALALTRALATVRAQWPARAVPPLDGP